MPDMSTFGRLCEILLGVALPGGSQLKTLTERSQYQMLDRLWQSSFVKLQHRRYSVSLTNLSA